MAGFSGSAIEKLSSFLFILVSCLIILPTTPTSPTVFPRVNAISCKQWQAMKTQERNTIASNHFLASLLYSPAHLFDYLQSHHHLSTLQETFERYNFERSSRRWHVNDNTGINHFLCHKILTGDFSTPYNYCFAPPSVVVDRNASLNSSFLYPIVSLSNITPQIVFLVIWSLHFS